MKIDLSEPRHFRRDGTPYEGGVMEWARDFEKADRIVGCTKLWWGGVVSTVWLGLNHNWGFGPPLIFETMLFGPRGGCGYEQVRYSSEAEALAGHNRFVKKHRNPLHYFIERMS